MSLSSLIVSVGLVALILYLLFRWRSKHIRELTDGMPGIKTLPWWALIEHFLAKDKTCNYNLYNVLEKIIAPFPDLSKGWLGPFCMIDLRKPEYIKKVLNSEKCIDRASFYSFPYKTGLLISGGELWKRHRKILNPVFSTNKLNKFMPIVNEKARKLGEAVNAHINKGEFNVVRLLSALTLENLLQSSFGLEKDFINNPFDKFFAIVKKEASNIGTNISNMIYLFIPKIHQKNEFSLFCQHILEEAQEESNACYNADNFNFVETLLANRNLLTDDEIQDEVCTMILAGNASTALSMSSVLLMLAIHQDVQEKLFEEINSVFRDSEEEIDRISLSKLKYLDLVIKETMRLFPVAPMIGRRMTADLALDDEYTLPKGSDVIIRIIDVQRNPALWGPDAHLFKPERFLPDHINKVHPYAFIPFSAGSRICIGYRYASNVMKIVLCHLLRKFKVKTSLKYEELQLEISFILRISQNYMIEVEARKSVQKEIP